ncbi:hypothetical protein GIS00_01100 [Nakamurella sp. YIM 132087]|uniref:ATP-grasp domain-containing protein n=1 Tax=Nakamurella alba TaxID=2665158 RepID=A0A7K1FEL7_9ACTN|nr:acetate--CoA ligase family protein [Nakamurella alba]MTD12541.1 hypothetical protein [Nakamurella alba]
MIEFADLRELIAPRSITLIGAGETGLGAWLTRNVLEHSTFAGPIHLVTDRRPEVFGRPTFPSVADIDGEIDVALILLPRGLVPQALRDAQAKGARFAVIMAGGFGEFGDEEGIALDRELREVIAAGSTRVVGPNSPGVGSILAPLGLTIQPGFKDELSPGPIGLIAQSGGVTRAVLQDSHRGVGFSAFFATGNQMDLDVADYLNYFVQDAATKGVALAIESVPSSDRFVEAAERARAAGKPVVMLKTGTSEAGRKAASSHTGAVVGEQGAMRAVAAQHGISVVDDLIHLVNVVHYRLAVTHGNQGWTPRSREVAIVGMSGGSGVLVADALATNGVGLAELDPSTKDRMRLFLPPTLPLSNPLDLADASFRENAFEDSLRLVAQDPGVGALLVIFNAWYENNSMRYAKAAIAVAAEADVPVIPVWMSARGGPELDVLVQAGLLPVRSATEAAATVQSLMADAAGPPTATTSPVNEMISTPRLPDGTILEDRAKQLLDARGVRVSRELVVDTLEAAKAAADAIGYPVILKGLDDSATHRAGTGLVSGAVRTAKQLVDAWNGIADAFRTHTGRDGCPVLVAEFVEGELEAYIGLKRDPEWGMILSLGLGGRWIEEIADAAVLPLPATAEAIENALTASKLARAIERSQLHGAPRAGLLDIAVRIAALGAEHPEISELDVNPVILTRVAAVAVDALITVERCGTDSG